MTFARWLLNLKRHTDFSNHTDSEMRGWWECWRIKGGDLYHMLSFGFDSFLDVFGNKQDFCFMSSWCGVYIWGEKKKSTSLRKQMKGLLVWIFIWMRKRPFGWKRWRKGKFMLPWCALWSRLSYPALIFFDFSSSHDQTSVSIFMPFLVMCCPILAIHQIQNRLPSNKFCTKCRVEW